MSATDGNTSDGVVVQDLKLVVVVIPVADVDRSKSCYANLGWRLDADFAFENGFRVIQFTSPGSPTSVQFGTKMTTAEPGTAHGLYLVVSDIDAARKELASRGVEVSEAEEPGAQFEPGQHGAGRVTGRAADGGSYGSFATLVDPDGNTWLLQQVTARLPGRIAGGITAYASVNDLMQALVRASTAHGQHEQLLGGGYDEQWPQWYATYMVAEQTGAELPQ